MSEISANTQAILLLTAPLVAGRRQQSEHPLSPTEYRRLARHLHEAGRAPEDLLSSDASTVLECVAPLVGMERLERLLARGFQLSQAMERWSSRAIWVLSRADGAYPARLKKRLKEDAPSVIYGCGDKMVLDGGGLAVVGSRRVDEDLLRYTEEIGRLASRALCPIVSGGARGVDRTAMSGALSAGGRAVGVLADALEKAVMARENRGFLMDEQLVFLSPYDPSAGFNVGNAMQRNKLIYALSDFALIVNADLRKGGTWAGAVEQLEKHHSVPVFVRSTGTPSQALSALRQSGAHSWPEPRTSEELEALWRRSTVEPVVTSLHQEDLLAAKPPETECSVKSTEQGSGDSVVSAADDLFGKVRELLMRYNCPKLDTDIAADLGVTPTQARQWLRRLVDEGAYVRYSKPVRYGPKTQRSLLDQSPE